MSTTASTVISVIEMAAAGDKSEGKGSNEGNVSTNSRPAVAHRFRRSTK
jgi:hypothetical protein